MDGEDNQNDPAGEEEQADFGDMGPEGEDDKFGMEGMEGEDQENMDWGEENGEGQQ